MQLSSSGAVDLCARFRFSEFKSEKNFTLVSDNNVKIIEPEINHIDPGLSIVVRKGSMFIYKDNALLFGNPADVS